MEKEDFCRILRSDLKLRKPWISAIENCTFNHHVAENYDFISGLLRERDNAGLKIGEYRAVAPAIAPPESQSVLLCLVGDREEQFLIYRFNSTEVAARYGHVSGVPHHAVLIDSFIFRSVPFLLGGLVEPEKETCQYSDLILVEKKRPEFTASILLAMRSLLKKRDKFCSRPGKNIRSLVVELLYWV